MTRFANSKRSIYTSSRVRKMRAKQELIEVKKPGFTREKLQTHIGKLQAAGHMQIVGFNSFNIERKTYDDDISRAMGSSGVSKKITLEYEVFNKGNLEDRPHFIGYLRSASDMDKQYRLKGWLNDDGIIRIELVN